MSPENNIVVGDLVKWFETYSDINIVRDYGTGTVLKTQKLPILMILTVQLGIGYSVTN